MQVGQLGFFVLLKVLTAFSAQVLMICAEDGGVNALNSQMMFAKEVKLDMKQQIK